MSIGDFGIRLTVVRKEKYKSVIDAVAAMNKSGFGITSSQFYELQSGQWPTRSQLVMLCDFFNVEPQYLLLGVEPHPINALKKEHKIIVELLVKQFNIDSLKLPPPTDQ